MQTRIRTFFVVSAAALIQVALLWLALAPAKAAPLAEGDLDPTFGNSGVVTTSISGQIQKMTVSLDGDVLTYGTESVIQTGVAPYFVHKLARFNGDGTLDPSFGVGGVLTLPLVISGAFPDRDYTAVTLLPDGRFLVAAQFNQPPFANTLSRYTATGSLDPSFGAGGVLSLTATVSGTLTSLTVYDMAVRPSGEIVLAGNQFVAQLSITHTFDTRFGTNGVVLSPNPPNAEFNEQVFVQADGNVAVIARHRGGLPLSGMPVFYRFDLSGNPLPTGPGLSTTCQWNLTQAVLTPDGKFLATARGSSPGLFCDQTLVGRLNSDFTLDSSFTVLSGTVPIVNLVQTNGRIIGTGSSILPSGVAMSAFRYTPMGTSDSTFGSGGVATAVISSTYAGTSGTETITQSYGYAAATQLNGRITVGGSYVKDDSHQNHFALARFVGPAVDVRAIYLPFITREDKP